ncbi:hypothetical protein C5G87_07115 [Paenibacillus peoriae]|uniref:hypothetical protein n=1 Tax=Paenibacillus peoriae TaxID=59893 RepID=UPI000CEBB4C4|nr:hypothetical protein [Paenibacillus peoriae]PPQ49138.1 hypothetical protein C5G87_07115 [Paenibacillus peoriae]
MASNTPNLDLYMKDPVADGNDLFNVETMMNDNWEKIDNFAGGMDEVKERLNTISRQDVTLQPGVQVINVAKSALFQLSGLTGRMLVNLLGRMGNCENVGLWSSNTTIALDTTNKTSGNSSFKLTLGSVPATASASFLTTPGKKYVSIADVKNGNTSKVAISINGIAGAVGDEVSSASVFAPSVVRFAATDYFHILTITGTGAAGSTFNMDSVRVYEISEADYAAAASYTPAQAAAKWPYVDSIMPVRNPYAIRWTDANKSDIASMLALQTDLYADPITGANADTLFQRDGQYFKNKNWQGLTLDGSLPWVYYETATGYKVVRLPITNGLSDRERVAKYDGKLIQHAFPVSAADQSYLSAASNALGLSIPVADSGWADGYTPTTEDIKAYFYGYKAYDANTFFPADAQVATTATWNGTGTKYWVQRVGAANYTQTVPQASYAGYTPYQLVYQLTTPTVEPIISEGQFAFVEGDNQVEVGTGIVLREVVKPQLNGQYFINGATTTSSALKNRVGDILRIYRNSKDDKAWEIIAHSVPANQNLYGFKQARLDASLYDPSASYSATYLMLDKSPVAAFVGSYAANEKTLLADLVDSVQQTSTRLSVVENKKADKDSPAWITPTTLLNGWVSMGVLGYRKIDNKVQVKARIKSGVIGQPFMILPEGYRPLVGQVRPVHSYTTTDVFAAVLINADGKFIVSGGSNNEVNIYLDFTTD